MRMTTDVTQKPMLTVLRTMLTTLMTALTIAMQTKRNLMLKSTDENFLMTANHRATAHLNQSGTLAMPIPSALLQNFLNTTS